MHENFFSLSFGQTRKESFKTWTGDFVFAELKFKNFFMSEHLHFFRVTFYSIREMLKVLTAA